MDSDPGPSPRQKLRIRLREIKEYYLLEVTYGNSKEYRQRLLNDIKAHPKVYQGHLEELVCSLGTTVWEKTTRPKSSKQPCLPGLEHVFDLTIYDKDHIGDYLKVLVSKALCSDLRDDATINYGTISKATAIASYEMDLFWKLMKANGKAWMSIMEPTSCCRRAIPA